MYYKNIKRNGKIVNHYKLSKNYIPLHVPISWLLTIIIYTQTKHVKKSTCLLNAGFCQLMYIPSLILQDKVLYISDGCCKEFNRYYFILYLFSAINDSISKLMRLIEGGILFEKQF